MKLLLDTHSFIWWDGQSKKLSAAASTALQDTANEVWLSLASVWEMQIKIQLGKMRLRLPLAEIVAEQQQRNRLQTLPITMEHIFALAQLPAHHGDPFDRLLIAQANTEQATFISKDPDVHKYSIKLLW